MVKVKICGLKTMADIKTANRLRPDFTGFVFYPLSKRYVSLIKARGLKAALARNIKTVGVFVNAPVEEIAAAADEGIINMVQLHGDENNAYITRLKAICTLPVIKAVRVKDEADIKRAAYFDCEYLLFDTYSRGAYGGTGRQFDLRLLAAADKSKPYFLAGGLTPENVRQAIKTAAPYAVDVSGGVETDGVKDAAKIAAFIKQAKG